MAHHARIEEVSDSEPEDMDPSDFDPQAFAQSLMGPSGAASGSGGFLNSQLQPQSPFGGQQAGMMPGGGAMPGGGMPGGGMPGGQPNQAAARAAEAEMREKSKRWQCIYPVYFDASRTRAEGRRVGTELGVANPLARELVDAVAALGLTQVVFEPGKTHPKDWSNPGRVRVLVKKEDGTLFNKAVKNSESFFLFLFSLFELPYYLLLPI